MTNLFLYLSVASSAILIVFVFRNLEMKDALTIVVLLATAWVLAWTVTDANKNSRESRLTDIRPVILRDGFIANWPGFQQSTEQNVVQTNFFVANNIATNVHGYVVVKEKKYPFFFTITKQGDKPGEVIVPTITQESVAGWTLPNKLVVGATFSDSFASSTEPEGIYVFYNDIEGNEYKTYENNKFVSESVRVSP